MIKLKNTQGQRPRVAEVELMTDGSVVVREGHTPGKMGTKSTPAGMIQGSPEDFMQVKVRELLDRGFHVQSIQGSQPETELTFGLRNVSLDIEVAVALVKEFCQQDVTAVVASSASYQWVMGGALVNWEDLPSGPSISCKVPLAYAYKAAAFFALTGQGTTALVDGNGGDVLINSVISEGVHLRAYSDEVIEQLYQARILHRPVNLAAFRNPHQRRGLTMSM